MLGWKESFGVLGGGIRISRHSILSLALALDLSFNDRDGAKLLRKKGGTSWAGTDTPDISGFVNVAVTTTEFTDAVL